MNLAVPGGSGSTTVNFEIYDDLQSPTVERVLVGVVDTVQYSSNNVYNLPGISLSTSLSSGAEIVATATALNNGTSAFSPDLTIPASPYVVTNNASSGPGSLYEVIQYTDANPSPSADHTTHVSFDITGSTVISVSPSLPAITVPVTLNGSNPPTMGPVQINGVSQSSDGLILGIGSDGSTIEGLIIANFNNGIHIESTNNTISDNLIGTDGNPADTSLRNEVGVFIDGTGTNTATGNTVSSNTIGFNISAGVSISGANATGNTLTRNDIGTNPSGDNLANVVGVSISASNNAIGQAGAGNTIGFNSVYGVSVLSGSGNSISQNLYEGSNGPALPPPANDIDISSSANNGQTPPTIVVAALSGTGSSLTLQFNLTVPGGVTGTTTVAIEVYEDLSSSSPTLRQFVGTPTSSVAYSSSNSYEVTVPLSPNLTAGDVILATATASNNGTSAFSAAFTIPVSAYVVTTNAASGAGSLAQVIQYTDSNPSPAADGTTHITFNISGSTVISYNPSFPLLITVPVTLDGFSQPTSAPVQINGGGTASDGIVLGSTLTSSSAGSVIEGVDIAYFGDAGIHVETANNTIENNLLGTNPTGTIAGPGNGVGVLIDGTGTNTASGNTILSNTIGFNISAGVSIGGAAATGNIVIGNDIGTNSSGRNLGNPLGIAVSAPDNRIGGTTAAAADVIGFNGTAGIQISGAGNLVEGDYIGTDAAAANLSNVVGVLISGGSSNMIGGTVAGEGNTIGFSSTFGVSVTSGNGNVIQGNEYTGNQSLESSAASDISLSTGANNGQIAPTLDAATLSDTQLTVALQFTNGYVGPVLFDIYQDISPGHRTYLQTVSFSAAPYVAAITVSAAFSGDVVATATVAGNGTSEFSAVIAPAGPTVVTNTLDYNPNTSPPGTPIPGSLRYAISQVSPSNPDVIFDIQAISPFVITLLAPIDITTVVNIEGITQPGVQVNGGGNSFDGLVFGAGSGGSTIIGLAFADFTGGNAIHVESSNDTITENMIGVDGEGNDVGIFVDGALGGTNVTIGGTSLAAANIIGFNNVGVSIGGTTATTTLVENNYIGTDATDGKLGNTIGIAISSSGNVIGGGNVIGRNDEAGISISGTSATGNSVVGNYIGIDPLNPKENLDNSVGIVIDDAADNLIGGGTNDYYSGGGTVSGTLSMSANYIGRNSSAGVSITGSSSTGNVVSANFIGVDPSSQNSTAPFNEGNGTGILIDGSAYLNTIGAPTTTVTVTDPSGSSTVTGTVGGNIVGFNSVSGISIGSSAGAAVANLVYGNYVGTDFFGDRLGNSIGAIISDGSSLNILGPGTLTATISGVSQTVGQTGSGLGNIISSNGGDGVLMEGANQNLVQGNTLGATTSLPGESFAGNEGSGIAIVNSFQNSIGGTVGASIGSTTGAIALLGNFANLILGNVGDGVSISIGGSSTLSGDVISGNWISGNNNGVDVSGDLSGSLATFPLPSITYNFIGTNQYGTSVYDSAGNHLGNSNSGILLEESSSNSLGASANALDISGNIISGNGLSGITAQQSGSSSDDIYVDALFYGNIVGLDVDGATADVSVNGTILPLGNVLDGVLIDNVVGVTIGGTIAPGSTLKGSGNVISGNLGRGIEIRGDVIDFPTSGVFPTVPDVVEGNVIGSDITGQESASVPEESPPGSTYTFTLGNLSDGLFLFVPPNVQITGNVVSNNRGAGIHAATQVQQSLTNGGSGSPAQSSPDVPSTLTITGNTIGTNAITTLFPTAVALSNGSDGIFIDSLVPSTATRLPLSKTTSSRPIAPTASICSTRATSPSRTTRSEPTRAGRRQGSGIRRTGSSSTAPVTTRSANPTRSIPTERSTS